MAKAAVTDRKWDTDRPLDKLIEVCVEVAVNDGYVNHDTADPRLTLLAVELRHGCNQSQAYVLAGLEFFVFAPEHRNRHLVL